MCPPPGAIYASDSEVHIDGTTSFANNSALFGGKKLRATSESVVKAMEDRAHLRDLPALSTWKINCTSTR